jgi:ABC-2 type transport system permease protein
MSRQRGWMPPPLRRIWGLIRKEFLQIVRDPSSILIAFVLPMTLLFLFAYGISLDISRTHIGIAIKKMTPEANDFLKAFTGSRYFAVHMAHDPRELEGDLIAGRIRGLVVVPVNFSEQLLKPGEQAPIQVITDGSEPNTASFMENYVQGAWSTWLAQRSLTNPNNKQDIPGPAQALTSAEPKVWFNQQIESRDSLLPGAIPIIVTLVGTLLTTLVVAREWDRGTMEALISTPVSSIEIMISKFIPYFILGMTTMAFCVAVCTLWFHVPLRGSLLVLTLASALYLFNALGTGLWISTATKNQFAASQAALLSAFLPAFLLSGYLYEISSMPHWVQLLTAALPVRYFVTSLRTIFLAGDIWSVLIPSFAGMVILASILFLLVSRQTIKRLD